MRCKHLLDPAVPVIFGEDEIHKRMEPVRELLQHRLRRGEMGQASMEPVMILTENCEHVLNRGIHGSFAFNLWHDVLDKRFPKQLKVPF